MPKFLKSRYFRYGFLVFFMAMFANMLFNTYLVFSGASGLREYVKILWMFNVPWSFAGNAGLPPWAAQFAFGFYGVMATSTIIGMATMALFKPRSWCVYCPMGTMTQAVCRVRNKK